MPRFPRRASRGGRTIKPPLQDRHNLERVTHVDIELIDACFSVITHPRVINLHHDVRDRFQFNPSRDDDQGTLAQESHGS